MVLYISKPLWKSFKSNKDDDYYDSYSYSYSSSVTQPAKTQEPLLINKPSHPVSNATTERGRSQTRPKKKRVGPKIRIITPPFAADSAPGTHPNELLPNEEHLLAAPLPSQHEIRKVLTASHSPVSLRAVSPIDFIPSLDTLSPTRNPSRYVMSRGGSSRLRLRTKHLVLPNGRTETLSVARTALRRAATFSLALRRRAGRKTSASSTLAPGLVASPDRRRASGTWVRDRQGNPFWMNGMLNEPVRTAPLTVVVGADGAPEHAVSITAFNRTKKAGFAKPKLYL
ncbi:hypothetical protein IWX90DRAFT_507969 [Phyllosticta citrichinensis]|uniref:Uncharacterized protein n=1 Tax=Phyllosticta citrichinensis TaxID=1130410 RepID=A0ABR1XL87_9PEZI